jgi:hypothetical protein
LPDGLFSNQKYQFGSILKGRRLENVDTFYGHSEYFTGIWDSQDYLVHFVFLWCIFYGFGIMYQEKSGNPAPDPLIFVTLSFILSSLRT